MSRSSPRRRRVPSDQPTVRYWEWLTPRPARRKNQIPVFPAVAAAHEAERRAHASKRIRVEHGISHLKNWRALSRHLGRRDYLDVILRAVAGLVSSQEQAFRSEQLRCPPKVLPAGTAR